jgi:hypothetical protein
VGETSRARKSTALNQIRNLFRMVDADFMSTQIIAGFGSGEALIDDLAESPDKRLWLCEHEFSRVLIVAQRDGSILSHIIRQGWDGDRIQVRTRKKRSVADGAHLAVIGLITQDELRANLSKSDIANGFLNRFLIVCQRRSQLLANGGRLDVREAGQLARRVNWRINKAKSVGEVTRSPKAELLWEKLYKQMADDDPGGLLGAVVARPEAQVLRLSVAYALTYGSAVIKTYHLHAARAMWSYCRDSAAYVFGRGTIAETIYAGVLQAGSSGLSKTKIHGLLGNRCRAIEIDSALRMLEREGLIKITTNSRRGGRPQTRVTVIDTTEM